MLVLFVWHVCGCLLCWGVVGLFFFVLFLFHCMCLFRMFVDILIALKKQVCLYVCVRVLFGLLLFVAFGFAF